MCQDVTSFYGSYLNSSVEEQRSHQSLEAVGHGVPQLQVVAQIRAVRVQHKLVQVEGARQQSEVLVLNNSRTVRRQPALLQVREQVEQVNRREELHHSVAEKLQPLVVRDTRLGLALPPEP